MPCPERTAGIDEGHACQCLPAVIVPITWHGLGSGKRKIAKASLLVAMARRAALLSIRLPVELSPVIHTFFIFFSLMASSPMLAPQLRATIAPL